MKLGRIRSALIFGTCALPIAVAADVASDVPAFLVQSRSIDGVVTYRFTIDVERAAVTPTPPQAAATPIAPQTIRFAPLSTFDLEHTRMTLLDANGAATSETIVAEADPDGTLRPKLKAGSHWALPVAMYDRLVTLAVAASTPRYPGKPVTAGIAPLAGLEDVQGTIVTTAGSQSHLTFDATGSVTPLRDLVGDPEGARDNGRGPGGGRGRRGPDSQNQSRKADAVLHVEAAFRDRSLQHAEGTETLAYGAAGAASKLTWRVERVP